MMSFPCYRSPKPGTHPSRPDADQVIDLAVGQELVVDESCAKVSEPWMCDKTGNGREKWTEKVPLLTSGLPGDGFDPVCMFCCEHCSTLQWRD